MSDKQVIQWLKSAFCFGRQSDLALHSSYWAVWQSPARVQGPTGDAQLGSNGWKIMHCVWHGCGSGRTPGERGSGFGLPFSRHHVQTKKKKKKKKSLLATHLQKYTCTSKWWAFIFHMSSFVCSCTLPELPLPTLAYFLNNFFFTYFLLKHVQQHPYRLSISSRETSWQVYNRVCDTL